MENFHLSKKLHTDVLEEKYGPIHSEILRHDDSIREVHMLDKNNISRTYAVTFLTFDKENIELCDINKEIKNGGLIGKTFKDHGYEVRKNVISVFLINLSEDLKQKMETFESKAKVRLSEFYAKKQGESPNIYGIVSEIYSPDFRSAEINDIDVLQDNPTTNAMNKVGITKDIIWERLGNNNNFDDLKNEIIQAKELAKKEEADLKERLIQLIK